MEFELPRPLNGLAEYISVKEKLIELAPKSVTLMEAAALPSSALSAMVASKKLVRPGDRVLVLGGSGGVGCFFVQLVKIYGAEYVACTTSSDTMSTLGVDKVINYKIMNWWEDEELRSGRPFDLIVDLAEGRKAWKKATSSKLLSRKGHFLAFTADDPLIEIHNFRQTFSAVGPMMWRSFWTKLWPFTPTYTCLGDWLEPKPGRLAEVARLVDNGMKVVLDPVSPLTFNEADVRLGFDLMKQRRAHGKVVISIQE